MKCSRAQVATQLLLSGLVFIALTLISAPAVWAEELDRYKKSGQVGEQLDGYIGFVARSPSAEVKASVAEINEKRREKYTDIAKTRGIDVSQVAALAGKKLVERTPSGQYVKDGSGKWRIRK
jgi:hypothetical protein